VGTGKRVVRRDDATHRTIVACWYIVSDEGFEKKGVRWQKISKERAEP